MPNEAIVSVHARDNFMEQATERDKLKAAAIARQFIDDEFLATQFLLEAAIVWALREARTEARAELQTKG